MLILILYNVQYSQKPVFSFEKGLNGQNYSSAGSHHLVKKFPYSEISDSLPLGESPHPLRTVINSTSNTDISKNTKKYFF